jgi:hypothetical protein
VNIDRSKLIKWECLERYFRERRGAVLDAIFHNPLCNDSARMEILNKLDLSNRQKKFLLKVFDIDYLLIVNNKPILIEEKKRLNFNPNPTPTHFLHFVQFAMGKHTRKNFIRTIFE